MNKILPLPAKKVVKALENIGFEQIRQKGGHLFLQHLDGRTTVVPMHPKEEIGRGIINKLIKDAKLRGMNGLN